MTHQQEKATLEATIEAKTALEFDLRRNLQEATTSRELLEEEKKDYETHLTQIEADLARTSQELEGSKANAQQLQQDLACIERDLEAKTGELEDARRQAQKKDKKHKASIKTLEDSHAKALSDLEASNSADTTNKIKEIEDQV
jgi:chromosome segregation ATPase